MSTVLIVVLAVLAVLALLALIGGASASRRNRAEAAHFDERLQSVDQQLAVATAEDRGWEREALEGAARAELAAHRPGVEVEELELEQIRDEPGTDEDLAIFRVRAGGRTSRLTLGRRGGAWYAASVEDDG